MKRTFLFGVSIYIQYRKLGTCLLWRFKLLGGSCYILRKTVRGSHDKMWRYSKFIQPSQLVNNDHSLTHTVYAVGPNVNFENVFFAFFMI